MNPVITTGFFLAELMTAALSCVDGHELAQALIDGAMYFAFKRVIEKKGGVVPVMGLQVPVLSPAFKWLKDLRRTGAGPFAFFDPSYRTPSGLPSEDDGPQSSNTCLARLEENLQFAHARAETALSDACPAPHGPAGRDYFPV